MRGNKSNSCFRFWHNLTKNCWIFVSPVRITLLCLVQSILLYQKHHHHLPSTKLPYVFYYCHWCCCSFTIEPLYIRSVRIALCGGRGRVAHPKGAGQRGNGATMSQLITVSWILGLSSATKHLRWRKWRRRALSLLEEARVELRGIR